MLMQISYHKIPLSKNEVKRERYLQLERSKGTRIFTSEL